MNEVKRNDLFRTDIAETDWQILGKLELPVGSEADPAVIMWLTELLHPLGLHMDFLSNVLKSAQEAAARAMQVENVMKFEHVHLVIFLPQERASKGQTWGFFRIEKIESVEQDKSPSDHAIELYLYREGQ